MYSCLEYLHYKNYRINFYRHWFCCFFHEFSYLIEIYLCLKCCIPTTVCVSNLYVHVLVFQYARCDCMLWNDPLICCIYCEFSRIIWLKRYIFIKLSQIVYSYIVHNYHEFVNLFNHLWLRISLSPFYWAQLNFWSR